MASENMNMNPPPPPPPSQPATAPKPSAIAKPKIMVATSTTNGNATNGVQPVSTTNGSPNGSRILRPEGYVGYDSLPDQYVSRIIRDGFCYNILALGATGVGKTTLLEALFNTKTQADSSTRSHNLSNVSVSNHLMELCEGNIKLKLTLVESKGFGDQIDKCKFAFSIFKKCLTFLSFFYSGITQTYCRVHWCSIWKVLARGAQNSSLTEHSFRHQNSLLSVHSLSGWTRSSFTGSGHYEGFAQQSESDSNYW